MKKNITITLLIIMICSLFASCGSKVDNSGMWYDAVYTENTKIGEGSKTLYLDVTAEDKTIEITVKTDKGTVGEALTEYGIIAGEQSAYGLYVKTVNGMLADYDVNKTYWSFSKDGEALMQGVDAIAVEDGGHYGFTCTK